MPVPPSKSKRRKESQLQMKALQILRQLRPEIDLQLILAHSVKRI